MNRINHFLISKFTACWIPDLEGENNLSGDLSHKYSKPLNAKFIGPLSRFSCRELKKEYDLLILLSGPEPQRTILEKMLLKQVSRLHDRNFRILLVRGTPEGSNQLIAITENFWQVDFLLADQLNGVLPASDIIISRSGYSTVMDLAVLGKKAIFIPTPGQTEQEYLSDYLMRKKIFYSEKQKSFDLRLALIESKQYSGIKLNDEKNLLNVLEKIIGVGRTNGAL